MVRTPRRIDIRIGGIDLAAMPPGGERRLREAIIGALAVRLGHGEAKDVLGREGGDVSEQVAGRIQGALGARQDRAGR